MSNATHLNAMTDRELAEFAERWAHEKLPRGGNAQLVVVALAERILRPAIPGEPAGRYSAGRYSAGRNPHAVVRGEGA